MRPRPDYDLLRERMVRTQLEGRGIRSAAVLGAMRRVRREHFLPPDLAEAAYEDAALPIGGGQTISQPYVVAWMIDALDLEGGERVLEVGTGSGYAAAVLAEVAAEVYTIERRADLAAEAAARLAREGRPNVHVRCGDGTLGWPAAAPFDAIVVAAAGPGVPEALKRQLALGGRLVIPVGELHGAQKLARITRVAEDRFETRWLGGVRFVPLIGAEGWRAFVDPTPSGLGGGAA